MKKKRRQTFDSIGEMFGSGSVLAGARCVSGPPGMGKSQMIAEFAWDLPPGTRVFFIAHRQ